MEPFIVESVQDLIVLGIVGGVAMIYRTVRQTATAVNEMGQRIAHIEGELGINRR